MNLAALKRFAVGDDSVQANKSSVTGTVTNTSLIAERPFGRDSCLILTNTAATCVKIAINYSLHVSSLTAYGANETKSVEGSRSPLTGAAIVTSAAATGDTAPASWSASKIQRTQLL
jgi:hypothetical protein